MKTNNMIKWAACGASLMMMVTVSAWANDYWWNGGSGNWTDTNWSDAVGGDSNLSAGPTGITDNVVIAANGKTAGIITIVGSKQLNDLYLSTAGYYLNSGTLDFTGAASGKIQVNASGTIGAMLNSWKSIQFATANQTLTLNGGWVNPSTVQQDFIVAGTSTDIAKASTLILNNGTYTFTNGGICSVFQIGDYAAKTGGVVLRTGAEMTFAGNRLLTVNQGGFFKMEGGKINMQGSGGFSGLLVGWNSNGGFLMTGGTINQGAGASSGIIINVGNVAEAKFEMTGGEVNVRSFGIMGNANSATATATLNISGGVANVKGVALGSDIAGSGWMNGSSSKGTATLNLSGGRLNVGVNGIAVRDSGADTEFKAIINLSGGAIGNSGTSWNTSANMNLSNTNGGVTFDIDGAANIVTLSGTLSGSGGLHKVGGGTLLLQNAANTYTGDTIVDAGTFYLLGGSLTFSLAESTQLTLNSGAWATLAGGIAIDTAGFSGSGWQIIGGDLAGVTYESNFNVSGWTKSGSQWTLGDYMFDQTTGWVTNTAIPEPSTFGLLAVGAALMVGARLLRKRQ